MKKEVKRREDEMSSMLSDSNRYSTDKGEISLVGPCFATMQQYEIYCIAGDLFYDIERYCTLQESEKRIYELLKTK